LAKSLPLVDQKSGGGKLGAISLEKIPDWSALIFIISLKN
jgi:hypothetical protein